MLSSITQILTVLALLAASVSGASIGHRSNNLVHKRHANDNAMMQARAARRRDMSGFAKRAAEEAVAKRTVKKRGTNARRCAMSSAAFASSTASTTSSSSTAEPTSTSFSTTDAPSYVQPTTATPTSTKIKTKTKTSTSAAPTSSSTSDNGGSSSGGSSSGTTYTGDATFYATGLGACGITNADTDYICAVSHLLFDGFDGYTGGDPNNNPVCNKKIKATYQGKSVTVTVTDRCVGCAMYDLDFAPSAFDQLADEALGRLKGMTWEWI